MSNNNTTTSSSHEEEDPESLEASWPVSSSNGSEAAQKSDCTNNAGGEGIDVGNRKGADILLKIHDHLDLDRLQKMKGMFFVDTRPGELGVKEFSDALRLVLPDTSLSDEDLEVLFMKIDANNSGGVDWDEFTSFLLQLDEGSRNMEKVAQAVNLTSLPIQLHNQRHGSKGFGLCHRDMIEKVIDVERAGISAYVTCGRDGNINFLHKETFTPLRSIDHLDTIKAVTTYVVLGGKSWETDRRIRSVFSVPTRRALDSMKSAWVCDIQQMPLSNRIVAACLDRTLTFYEILTGEFSCRITGLRSAPTCVDCCRGGTDEQQVISGDSDGYLHVWTFEGTFYVPGPHDSREAAGLRGKFSNHIHEGAVCRVAYVADLDTVVTCGMDGKVHFFDLSKRLLLRTFGGHGDHAVFSFAYCTRHRFFVSVGMDRGVVFWNPYTMCVLAKGQGHMTNVRHCMVDEDSNRVITVSEDKVVRCWDSNTFRCIQSFKDDRTHRPDDTITAALWDGSRSSLILAGVALGVWRNQSTIQASTRTHEASVTAALYNKYFHQVVSGDALGTILVWMVETGHLAFRYDKAHGVSKIRSMCFDASQRRLLTGANDGRVKLWNFSNGNELQIFYHGNTLGDLIGGGNRISGLAYCKDNRGFGERDEYIITFSGDQQVRVYAIGNEGSGGMGSTRLPSRVFSDTRQPRHSGRRAEGDDDDKIVTGIDRERPSAMDVLCAAHCGEQQVATGTVDGRVAVWATDSGRVKFEMRPSEHDTSNVDNVSSIGGLTSAATRKEVERKRWLSLKGRNSKDSIGYLDRTKDILAGDVSHSNVPWNGGEFSAEEHMGEGDDDSGMAAVAKSVASKQEGIGVGAGGTKGINRIEVTGEGPGVTSNNNGTKTSETIARSLKKQREGSSDLQRKEKNQLGSNVWKAAASEPSATQTDASHTVPRAYEARASTLGSKLPTCGPRPRKGNCLAKSRGIREVGSTGEEAMNDSTPKTGAAEKKDRGIEQLLEKDPAYSVECLLYLRCHDILVSGTASGDIHFWDVPTGSFVFGIAANHPHGGGMSAMGSSEGNPTAEIVNDSVPPDVAPPAAAATTSRIGSTDLMLYTACDGGFVKTWKVGNLTEHVYQTELRARPEKRRQNRSGRGGRKDTRNSSTHMLTTAAPGGTKGKYATAAAVEEEDTRMLKQENIRRGIQNSPLQPVHQWKAHETAVASIEGANFRRKLELLVTAGFDCYVHLWTVAGAHVGAFGQPNGPWSLGNRATWQEPREQASLAARERERHAAETLSVVDPDEQESRSNSTRQDSPHLRPTVTRDTGKAIGREDDYSSGDKCLQQYRKHEVEVRAAEDPDVKAREELERHQQKRYYAASKAKMQRKLLRGQMAAFCMSQDTKESQLQEACQILESTVRKNASQIHGTSGKPGLGKSRIAAILRSTYNQVSFQLHLHQHDDVQDKAWRMLSYRKALRRDKRAPSTKHRSISNNRSGTTESLPSVHSPSTIPNTLLGTETIEITPPMSSTLPAAGVDTNNDVNKTIDADGNRALSFNSRGPYNEPSCSDSGGVIQRCVEARGIRVLTATGSEQIVLVPPNGGHGGKEDGGGNLRPAAPVQPLSSCSTSRRRFRRSHVGRSGTER